MKKISKEEIIRRISKKFGEEYIILDEYDGIDFPINIKHLKCNNIWKQTPYNFLKGNGCRFCNKKEQYNKISLTEYKKRVEKKYGNQYTVLEYNSAHEKIKVKHNYFFTANGKKINCGHIDYINDAWNFLKRHGKRSFCNFCKGHNVNQEIDRELKKDAKYCLYKHINTKNNKIYVGITSQTFLERWNRGYGYFGSIYFFNAILKDKWENFDHYAFIDNKWIKVNENQDLTIKYEFNLFSALKLEEEYIAKYRKDYGIKNVYNISSGGENPTGVRDKKVLQFSSTGIFIQSFDSIKIAAKLTGISYGTISNCCHNNCKSAGGFLWKFADDKSELIIPEKILKRNVPIAQYEKTGKFIKFYPNMKTASEFTGIALTSISTCCRTNSKQDKLSTAGGYIWKYFDECKDILVENPEFFWSKQDVYQFTLTGVFIKKFESMAEAERETGAQAIWNCCNKLQYQSGGYIWTFDKSDVNWYIEKIKNKRNVNQKNVLKFNLEGKLVKKYNSIIQCSKENNVARATISRCCNGKTVVSGGYIYLIESEDYLEELTRRLKKIEDGYFEKLNNRKKVAKCEKGTDKVIKIYNSMKEAADDNHIKHRTTISACCRGKVKTCAGFSWKYI